MGKRQCLHKLSEIIEKQYSKEEHVFYRNSFAIACYLIMQGETDAAKKHLSYFFDVLGRYKRQTYFSNIVDSIEEFSVEYAGDVGANLEINKLFDGAR